MTTTMTSTVTATVKFSQTDSSWPSYFFGFVSVRIIPALTLLALLSVISLTSMAATVSSATLQNLSQIHDEIDALPIDPEVRQQMLLFIEVAESHISNDNMGDAREAVLDFCRRIEWYRYQIGHAKIDNMFNQAMVIAVELHNAATG